MKKLKIVLQIAATYIGTVVGAGFATGKEIVEFFVSSGFFGFFGILIAGLSFIWIGTKIMKVSHRMEIRSFESFNSYLFGPTIGRAVNLLFLIILVGATSVMISGVGATFKEQLGLPALLGTFLILILSFFTVLKGVNGIFLVNSVIVPFMILFSLCLFLLSVLHQPIQLPVLPHAHLHVSVGKAVLDAFLYASYNLVLAEVVLVPLGSEIKNEKSLKWGGLLGGVGLTLILSSSYFVLSVLPHVETYSIPMAEAIQKYGSLLHLVYVVVVFGEIFSTVVANLFGLTLQLEDWFSIPKAVIIGLLLLLCFLLSLFQFGPLLAFIYRLFGIVGMGIFFYLIYLPLPQIKR